jgi:hypothetical protein
LIQEHRCSQRASKAGRLEQLFPRFRRTDDDIVTRAVRWAELVPFGPFLLTYGGKRRKTLQTEPMSKIPSSTDDAHSNDPGLSIRDDKCTVGRFGLGSIEKEYSMFPAYVRTKLNQSCVWEFARQNDGRI